MKVIKWLFISVFGFAALVVGAYLLFPGYLVYWSSASVGADGGAGSRVMHSLFHDGARYYELTANLEVDGESVEIKRVIECKPYFAHRPESRYEKRWYTDQEAMTQRLPDGSGVIVVGPRLCNSAAHPQPADAPPWKAFPDLPEDYVPLILWTANADNPEMLEGYFSFDSVERPGSRISFKDIALRNNADLEPGSYPEEFGLWVNAKFGGLRGGSRPKRSWLNYKGLYLTSLTERQWSKVPALKSALEAMTASGFIDRKFLFGGAQMFTGDDQYAIDGVMSVRRKSDDPRDRVGEVQIDFDVLSELRGFEQSAHGYSLSGDEKKGVIAYFRRTVREKGNWVRKDFFELEIGDQVVKWPNKIENYYYEHKRKLLFHVDFSYLTFFEDGKR